MFDRCARSRDDGLAMESQVVVWNVDARNRPELEVEIELAYDATEVPGLHLAAYRPELEVEMTLVTDVDDLFDGHDAWFVGDDDVALDDYTVYDTPPRGYADAYKLAI
jgi:hypothetical protein